MRGVLGSDASHGALWLRVPLVVATLTLVVLSCHLRWSLASSLPWQCDELPLLVRYTGLCSHATNEAEARAFEPSFYSFRTGAIRSMHVPDYYSSLHTTTGFWANIGLHVFGYGTASGRAGSLFWSMVAVVAAAWAGWLVTRSVPGACLSALFVSLAPMTTAYGAQARGYAEAMALTLLLLIALEYLRRAPNSWLRATALFGVAFQLSLTVYTMWVYFVFPALAVGIWLLPRRIADARERQCARCVISVIFAALVVVMALYTVERWTQFSLAPASFGERVESLDAATSFVARWLDQAMPILWIGVPLTVGGLFVIGRSTVRWWLWPLGLSVLVPALFAVVNGSPGYVRNFVYWVGPLAVLTACGADALVRWVRGRAKPAVVHAMIAMAVAGGGGFAYAGLAGRARAILLPDWGALVQALNAEPELYGPRFVCPGLANHWQIEWYDASAQTERLLALPHGGTIEVVFGAQYNESGRLVVYRRDPDRSNIPERAMPAFLSAIAPASVRFGIEVRRFTGREVTATTLERLAPDTPVFIVGTLASKPSADQWTAFLRAGAVHEAGLVAFASQLTPDGLVQTMIAPASVRATLRHTLPETLGAIPTSIRVFALSPLS